MNGSGQQQGAIHDFSEWWNPVHKLRNFFVDVGSALEGKYLLRERSHESSAKFQFFVPQPPLPNLGRPIQKSENDSPWTTNPTAPLNIFYWN